ncbi:MAG: hypothetical protein ABIP63_10255 [Thermoanaerobaculia bacterium]
MKGWQWIAIIGVTALSCGRTAETPAQSSMQASAQSPNQSPGQSGTGPAAVATTEPWPTCPVTRQEVAAATGMDTGKAHFRESSSDEPARCTFTVGSSGIVELYNGRGVTASNYLTEIATSLFPGGANPQWKDAPDLGSSGKTACGLFKDPLLNSCVAVTLRDSLAIVVMVSTGESKTDVERTAAAIALAKKTVRP